MRSYTNSLPLGEAAKGPKVSRFDWCPQRLGWQKSRQRPGPGVNCQWLRPKGGGWALCEVRRCGEAGAGLRAGAARASSASAAQAGKSGAGNGRVLATGAGGRAPVRGCRGSCRPQLHPALPEPLDP